MYVKNPSKIRISKNCNVKFTAQLSINCGKVEGIVEKDKDFKNIKKSNKNEKYQSTLYQDTGLLLARTIGTTKNINVIVQIINPNNKDIILDQQL